MAMKDAVKQAKPDEKSCPKCNGILNLRHGKNGAFWGCNRYPECDYTVSAKKEDAPINEKVVTGSVERFAIAAQFVKDCEGVTNALDAVRSVALMIASVNGESN